MLRNMPAVTIERAEVTSPAIANPEPLRAPLLLLILIRAMIPKMPPKRLGNKRQSPRMPQTSEAIARAEVFEVD
jgi:hypothetical protein